MCAREVGKDPHNSLDILGSQKKRKTTDFFREAIRKPRYDSPNIPDSQNKRKETGFFKKEIKKPKLESKETETNKQLQDFDKQGDGIVHKAKDITKKGLKGYQPFSVTGVFDGSKRDVSDDEKKHDEKIRYWNNTYAWQCSYDMGEMIGKLTKYLQGFKDVKDLLLKQKEQEKKVSIGVKASDDPAKLANSASLEALEHLHKIPEEDTLGQIKDMIEQGETYLYIHAPAGKVVINGIFWHMHRIEDVKSAGEGKTKIEWDTNRANLVIEGITRDGKQTEERPYVKTLANGDFESENFRLRFVTPYAGGTNRKEAKLIIERRQGDGKWEVQEEDVNLTTLRTIRVKEVYEGGKLTVTVAKENDVAPDIADTELLHSKILSHKPGFEPEKAQRMYMMHLPSRSIIFPNGRRQSFDDFKWNALRDDGDGIGLKCRGQGPTVDLPYFSVSMAGQDLQSPEMMGNTNKLNTEIRHYLSNAFELLNEAIKKNDENLLNSTFSHIENNISRNISQLEILKNAYHDPPKDRTYKPQEKVEAIDGAIRQVSDFLKESKNIYEAAGKFGEELNKSIQKIDLKDTAQEAQQQHRNEIKDVYHLKEAFEVELLDDPNLGACILEIARKAGEAASKIEKVKSPGTAEKARIDAENTIIGKYIKARDAYLKEKGNPDKALGAFHTAIQENILQYKITLQAKAEIVKGAESYAKDKNSFSEENIKFIEKQINSALEAKKAEIVKEQKDKVVNYIKKKDLKNSTAERLKKINEYNKKIDNVVEKAILESKAKGKEAYDQYECAIKAAIETAFKLEKYGNDQKDIEKESGDSVEKWLENTRNKLDEAPKCIEQAAIDKILNLKTDIESEIKEEIKESAKKAKKDYTGGDKIEQHKLAVEAAIRAAHARDMKPEGEEDVENWIKNAREEFDKALKGVKRATIEKVKKDIESEEDKQNLKKQIDAAHEKLKKAKQDAESSAKSRWNNDEERGNILAKAKLDEIENELKKLPEKEKGAVGMRIAVQKAYEVKRQALDQSGIQIEEIPEDLGKADTSAGKMKEMAKGWDEELHKVDHTSFDGAELMQERRRLKSYAKDPSGDLPLDERYDHLVKQAKLKQIEDIIDTNPKVHYSYRIMLNIARAYEAVLEDNHFWKHDKNKVKIEGVLDYLGRVKTEVEDHKNELGKLRADFLHKVVEFVRAGISERRDRQASRVLLPVLVRAQRVLETDLDNLELVKQVLNSKTSDEAKKIKDKLKNRLSAEGQRSALGLDEIRHDIEKIAKDIGEVIEDRLMKNGSFDFGELEKLRPSEKLAWRHRLQQQFRKNAEAEFEAMLNPLNSEQRAIQERKRDEFMNNMIDRSWKDYQRTETMNFQLYKIDKFKKQVDKQMWRDAAYMWFLNFMQNGMQASNRGANMFIQQIEKVMKESAM